LKYKKISVLGVGLIGGGIGISLKKRGLAEEVWGWGRNKDRLQEAISLKACDKVTTGLDEAIKDAEIIIMATPPDIIIRQFNEIKPFLKKGMLVMDVGSVKMPIVKAAKKAGINRTGAEFIGSHPMAGSDKTGVHNATGDMFKKAHCIITPAKGNSEAAVSRAREFWQLLGGEVVSLDPGEHDLTVGFSSHLPHVISSSLASCYRNFLYDTTLLKKIAGPSFDELTRIAAASPDMWMQIYMRNRKNVLLALEKFQDEAERFKKLLSEKNEDELRKFLEEAADFKKNL